MREEGLMAEREDGLGTPLLALVPVLLGGLGRGLALSESSYILSILEAARSCWPLEV